jgi:hypothetical protein
VIVKSIVSAESQGKRDEAEGELTKQIVSDVVPKDFIKDGATKVTIRLFEERVAPYLVEGASFSANVGALLLDSTKTGRGPNEIIHDSSGKVSLTEKQVRSWICGKVMGGGKRKRIPLIKRLSVDFG